jgi:hypothetical protein
MHASARARSAVHAVGKVVVVPEVVAAANEAMDVIEAAGAKEEESRIHAERRAPPAPKPIIHA